MQERKSHQQHHSGEESLLKKLLSLQENSPQSDNGCMQISLKPYLQGHKIELFKENNMMITLLFSEEKYWLNFRMQEHLWWVQEP